MKRFLQAAAGLAVSGVALWLTLRGKDLGAIWAEMRQADYRYFAPYVLLLLTVHVVRTLRWGILLEPVAKIPFARLNAASAVGFMALVALPFRLGEFARPYLIAERPRIRVSSALSSIVAERVVDGIFTGVLLLVLLGALPAGTPGIQVLRVGGGIVSAAFGGALVFLVVAYRNRELAVRLTSRFLGVASPR
ncbi:MAG TPA: lysylphosphatidylglycerol synthase transmembrane domain-containing protein, partial [Anaeromyxobacteraceae bacterium]|nr:lysylphosphatidylglycerol synthase transmembrane domain-containing protein [Anaeromyxobacteraceae bacterium]